MPPRKKYAFMWTCCYCGQSGMTVVVDPCPNCHYPRCSRCRVDRVQTRGHDHEDCSESSSLPINLNHDSDTAPSSDPEEDLE
ncbi:hypothetical protein CCHR01_19732 [Colletotrichum chrysophilum]|uniref:Uncharacterized protein n=1 Tax=Colletotrichum chrysophilum TaxID=1836956 RepID=A0AAD9EA52_9PEZI|nr:hypothetical protein CCHR01_19732 [Colletotrichum chrysophilum]